MRGPGVPGTRGNGWTSGPQMQASRGCLGVRGRTAPLGPRGLGPWTPGSRNRRTRGRSPRAQKPRALVSRSRDPLGLLWTRNTECPLWGGELGAEPSPEPWWGIPPLQPPFWPRDPSHSLRVAPARAKGSSAFPPGGTTALRGASLFALWGWGALLGSSGHAHSKALPPLSFAHSPPFWGLLSRYTPNPTTGPDLGWKI